MIVSLRVCWQPGPKEMFKLISNIIMIYDEYNRHHDKAKSDKKGILGVMLLATLQDKTRVNKETEVG